VRRLVRSKPTDSQKLLVKVLKLIVKYGPANVRAAFASDALDSLLAGNASVVDEAWVRLALDGGVEEDMRSYHRQRGWH
jgi:hypothetical protein